jgi:transforming growth factor-beta-induced protein
MGGGTGGGGGADAGMPGTIVDVAAGNPEFTSLVAAVAKAGLASTLADPSKDFTVFAPTNAAFASLLTAIGASSLDDVSAEQLKPILLYHVLGTKVDSTAATAAATSNAKVDALGGKIQLSLSGSTIKLDGKASVTAADVAASNGVIHVIDQVILPSITDIVITDARFSSLALALTLADTASPSPGLVAALDDDAAAGGFTVFAPTNDAFSGLVDALKGNDDGATTGIAVLGDFRPDQVIPVLKYHVIGGAQVKAAAVTTGTADTLGGKVALTKTGATVKVDDANVIIADVLASNGVIHAIDAVLLPSITDVVTTDARFAALKGAVIAADSDVATTPKVGAALDGAGPFTLFAPNEAAFTALGAPPSGQALTNVLLYHAVPGSPIYAATALALTSPLTANTALAGKSIEVNAEGNPKGVTVKDSTTTKAKVVGTNVFTANGVIHVIDQVLIPSP